MNIDDFRNYTLENRIPFAASIELTQKCNFRCKHCYCDDIKNEMSTNEIFTILDKLYVANVLMLTFTGGEAFLRKDFVDIYMYAKEKGFIVSIMTNLSLLNRKTMRTLAEYRPRELMVTLYGGNEKEYYKNTGSRNSYNRIVRNLRILHKYNIKFMLKVILKKDTFHSGVVKRKFDALAEEYGTSIFYDSIIFPKKDYSKDPISQRLDINDIINFEFSKEGMRSEWHKAVNNKSNSPALICTGGNNSLSINSKGIANICTLFVENGISILNNEFSVVWHNLKITQNKLQDYYQTSECYDCSLKSICRWCPAYSKLENDTYTEKIDFFCNLAKSRVEKYGKNQ